MCTEPIFKSYGFSEIEAKLKPGNLKQDAVNRFKFQIQANTLNYIGTWHFDKETVSFSDEKLNLDKKLYDKFVKLNFKNAVTQIPN